MDDPGSSGGGGWWGDYDLDISEWLQSILNEEAYAAGAEAMEPMPHQQIIGVEGVVQHQHQLGLVDPQEQQLAGEEGVVLQQQHQLGLVVPQEQQLAGEEGVVQDQLGLVDPPEQKLAGEEGVVQDQLGLVDPPEQQLAVEEGVVQHQHQLALVDQQPQQLAVEVGEQQLHQQQATGTAEGVLLRGTAVPVVASVGREEQRLTGKEVLLQQATATQGILQHPAVPVAQASSFDQYAATAGVLNAVGPLLDIPRREEQRLTGKEVLQQQATATQGILQHPAVPVAQASSFDQYAATAGVLNAVGPLLDIPSDPYNFSTVDGLISCNNWSNLENYLRRYMPVHQGQLMHADVILRCRSEQLLLLMKRQQYDQAKVFLMREIIPLRQSVSPYVKTEKLLEEIDYISLCVSENRPFENLETNMKTAINDYMCFYLPEEIGFQQAGVNSAYWTFALRIERTAGVVTARCLLCHCVNSIKLGVVHHIGGQKCPKLTPYAVQLYESIVAKEKQSKGTKRKFDVLVTTAQVATQVNTSQGINHLMDVNGYLDEMLIQAGEIRVLHQTGTADLNQQVNRIIQLVSNIRHSVHHIAGATD